MRKVFPRLTGRAGALGALALAAGAVAGVAALPAFADPAAIASKQAEVAALQAQVNALDSQVEQASEAYNGARYYLGQVHTQIKTNQRLLARTTTDLGTARVRLGQRLADIYKRGTPSFVDILLASGGLSQAANSLQDLKRVSDADNRVMVQVRSLRGRQVDQRRALIRARKIAGHQVVVAAKARAAVTSLLNERASILRNAQGDLVRLIEEQRQAEIQAMLAARARAIAAERAQAAAVAQSGGTVAATGGTVATAGPPSGGDGSSASPAPQSGAPQTGGAPLPAGSTLGGGQAPVGAPSGNNPDAAAVDIAKQYLGTPYQWGGAGPGGFDCSGLASYVYSKLGKDVPHYTGAIYSKYAKVPRSDLQPGDLVFFNGTGHVGIYAGGGDYIHAPHTGDVVKVSKLDDTSGYSGAVRP